MIDGVMIGAAERQTRPVYDPATGSVIAQLPCATEGDLLGAVRAAARTFSGWRDRPAIERCSILKRAAGLIRERLEGIATTLTSEEGKTLAEARREVSFSADVFEWFAEESKRVYGRSIPSRLTGVSQFAIREAVGPVAAFSPWNFPAGAPSLKIAAALAAGCTCIIKPAEETPGTAVMIASALVEAGVPNGVLNVVFGDPAQISATLIAQPEIRKVSFTGSAAVGKQLAKLAADGLKRVTMELGGHAPVIVFDDADAEAAAAACATMKFRNAGQICISPTRFYVQRKLYPHFVEAFANHTKTIKVGAGLDIRSQMGPLANARRLDAMSDLVGNAIRHGAGVAAGGARINNQGHFWQPTVLSDVPPSARIMSEEPFGPVACLASFDDPEEAIVAANRLPYGLAAYVFTGSAKTAKAAARKLEAGLVGINGFAVSNPETPFGGVKQSGYGSEAGPEGLDAYLSTKFISHVD